MISWVIRFGSNCLLWRIVLAIFCGGWLYQKELSDNTLNHERYPRAAICVNLTDDMIF